MALSYAELIATPSKNEELRKLLELMTLAGFPATSWQAGSVGRTMLEIEAEALTEVSATIRQIALGGMLEEAEDDWLTLLASSVFQVERFPAVRTRGLVVLTCSPLAGPYTVSVGSITAATASGNLFRNVVGGVLPSGGTLALTVEAESPGASYNVGSGQITRIIGGAMAGVSINNPVVSGSSTWITQTGTDTETDEELRLRCKSKWATLGTGTTGDAYRFGALTASPEVKRVKVLSRSNLGVPADGHVTLYLAGPVGGVSAQGVDAVRDYFATRTPLCVDLHIESAIEHTVQVDATLRVKSAQRRDVEVRLPGYLAELAGQLDVGDTVYRSAIVEQLMRPDGMIDAVVSTPSSDVPLAFNEVPVITLNPPSWIEEV